MSALPASIASLTLCGCQSVRNIFTGETGERRKKEERGVEGRGDGRGREEKRGEEGRGGEGRGEEERGERGGF